MRVGQLVSKCVCLIISKLSPVLNNGWTRKTLFLKRISVMYSAVTTSSRSLTFSSIRHIVTLRVRERHFKFPSLSTRFAESESECCGPHKLIDCCRGRPRCRADRKSQVRKYLGFCTADFLSALAYESAKQKPKHCLIGDFLPAQPRCRRSLGGP